MPRASRIWASTKWPMRHFAMTGMVTAAMIDLISSGSDMRATPPSLRMSAGTRSSAMTAHAPASWAMRACSGVTTSMITPPFSIWARPALTLKLPFTPSFPLLEPLRSATFGILRPGKLEPLQYQGSLGGVLGVGQQAVAVKPRQHVHLLEHVEQGRHRPPREVGIGSGAGLLPASVELAHEEERLDGRKGNPELADRAVALLRVQVQHHAVSMSLEGAVEVASQHLAVKEADRHLAGRPVRQLLVPLELDPLHRREGDPGRLVVLQAPGVIHLDQEVRFVEIEVAGDALDGLVVKEADDYPSHFTPTVLTLIWLHSCAGLSGVAARSGGRIWHMWRCDSVRPRPAAGGACRRGTAPAAAPPPRGSARPPAARPGIPL